MDRTVYYLAGYRSVAIRIKNDCSTGRSFSIIVTSLYGTFSGANIIDFQPYFMVLFSLPQSITT